jgi:hypothetical protein
MELRRLVAFALLALAACQRSRVSLGTLRLGDRLDAAEIDSSGPPNEKGPASERRPERGASAKADAGYLAGRSSQ